MKLEVIFALVLFWRLDKVISTGNENSTSLEISEASEPESAKLLSRRRRYIVFPKGASLQIILEELIGLPTVFQVVLGPTLQVAWPLPSEPLRHAPKVKPRSLERSRAPDIREKNSKKPETVERFDVFRKLASLFNLFGTTVGLAWQLPDDPMIYSEFKKKHKIYKRNVLKKMEAFLRPGDSDGKQCVLRALCESGQRTPSKKGFVTEILHKIFSMEEEEEEVEENHEDKMYRKAHRSLNQNCETLYPGCHFSIFSAVQ